MIIQLDQTAMIEIAKALKSGYLDMGKVKGFKTLLDNYRPIRHIGEKELNFYLKCLFDGWGYEPTDKELIKKELSNAIEGGLLGKEWEDGVKNGQCYNLLVKYAFKGLIAVKALGGLFTEKEFDFSFIEKGWPIFE